MPKEVTKKDIEKQLKKQKEDFEKTLHDVSTPELDSLDLDISDQNVDALKYALHAIINNKGTISGTTNLSPKKIKALSRMKALNYFYRSRAITNYYDELLQLQRSETKNPISILESIGNLFKTPQMTDRGIGNKLNKFVRR